MFRLAVFVSGGGTNLQALIDRIADNSLRDIEICCVIASKYHTGAQQRAEKAGIDCMVVNRKDFNSQEAYDEALLTSLADKNIDLIVLAGFMSLLGSRFVRMYENKIINIHPSLIPAFCGHGLYGIRPHRAALEYGVKVSGATVHYVDEEYDTGPIILQKAVDVKSGDTPETLQLRIMQEAEQIILPQAVALIAAGRVRISGRQTYIIGGEIK
ncbi:MAG: phosphoribosylglycinamide formyltransferase [Eubacteriales bacterium]|nr:phosphoribosylglycinamide formyltransferase [Eubacteriales bacterium]MDD4682306.1 phosphoribosylglycinamide formyltransferase [Eubacteriales bacterium]